MEELLKREAKRIAELLADDYDIIIKKMPEGRIKIQYFRPRNIIKGGHK